MINQNYTCHKCGKKYKFDYSDCGFDLKNVTEKDIYDLDNSYDFMKLIDKEKICIYCLKELKCQKRKEYYQKRDKIQQLLSDIEKNYANISEDQGNKNIEEEEKYIEKELEKYTNIAEEKEQELLSLMSKVEEIKKKESKYWENFKILEKKIYNSEKEKKILDERCLILEQNTKNLSSTNTLNDLFQISFGEKYGIINGCRMGFPLINDEINAGWGYIIFLTKILSMKFAYESKDYDLIVFGNYSKIYVKKESNMLELRISEYVKIYDKFNEAMKAYLSYFCAFWKFLIELKKIVVDNSDFDIKISSETINGKNICLDPSKGDDWNQCIKYLLTCLKFLILQCIQIEYDSSKKFIENVNLLKNFDK